MPLLANLTEFGQTPLFSLQEMEQAGVAIVLYPLSAFRAMNAAALKVYQTIRQTGSQKSVVDIMQTREQLYAIAGLPRSGRKARRPAVQTRGCEPRRRA